MKPSMKALEAAREAYQRMCQTCDHMEPATSIIVECAIALDDFAAEAVAGATEREAGDGPPSLLLSVALSRDDATALHNYTIELIAAFRSRGEQNMRDAVLRWHEEKYMKYRALSGTSAIAGAYMSAHEQSIAAIRTLKEE